MRTRLRSKVTLLFIVCAALLAFAGTAMALTTDTSGNTAPSPTITSDLPDYAPGDTVTLTGSNWQPGEVVHINVNDNQTQPWSRDVDVTADSSGNITDQFQLPSTFAALYNVTATGPTSGTATMSFTDGNLQAKVGGSISSVTVSWEKFGNNGCTGSPSSTGSTALGNANTILTANDSGQSVKITAPSVSGHTFSGWSGAVTTTSNSVCVPGANGNQQMTATYAVAPATVNTTTTASNASATYGASSVTLNATVTPASGPAVNTGTVTFTVKDGTTTIGNSVTSGTVSNGSASASFPLSGVNAKTYTIEAVYNAGTGFNASNNSAQSPAPTLTINKKALTVTADPKSKTYGAPNPPFTFTYSNDFVSPDTAAGIDTAPTCTSTATASSSVAGSPYPITCSGGVDNNYSFTYVNGQLTVNQKAITITPASGQSKVYGQADPTLTYTHSPDLESGDSFTSALDRADGENVGTYAINLGDLSAGPNYNLSLSATTVNFAITARPITVSADPQTKVYGDDDPDLTYQVTSGSLINGDSFTGSLTRQAGESVAGSPYAIQQGSLSAGPNYTLTFNGANLTITARPITVTADAKTKILGAPDPPLTYQVTSGSLVTGDSFTGSLKRDPGETVGTYAIKQDTLSAGGNYAITYIGANLKIVFNYSGFLQPINDTAHQTGTLESKFKLGQTIPVKFIISDAAGTAVQQATNPVFTKSANRGACDASTMPEVPPVVTPDSGNQYIFTGGQYHYNWSTKGLTAGEYRIYANLADGSQPYVDICLTK